MSDELGLVPAPDLMNVVVGFRGFSMLSRDILGGGHGGWSAGENVAICGTPHKAPDNDCRCGLYAYHDCSRFAKRGRYGEIAAVVAAWGKLCVHADGFRAEKAQILAIAQQPAPDVAKIPKGMLENVAKTYGVPLLTFGDLEPYALEHGTPVPTEMIPGFRKSRLAIKSGAAPQGAAPQGAILPVPPKSPAVIHGNTVTDAPTRQVPVVYRDNKPHVQYVPNHRSEGLLLSLPIQFLCLIGGVYEGTHGHIFLGTVLTLFFMMTIVFTIHSERIKL